MMNMKVGMSMIALKGAASVSRVCHLLTVALLCFLLVACAAPRQKEVNHTFQYDGIFDKWAEDVDLLEYQYGDQYRQTQRKAATNASSLGPRAGVIGSMPVGKFLYVKWRVKASGKIYEDRVDLQALLPHDMTGYRITFVLENDRLRVFLVSPRSKNVSSPPLLPTYLSKYLVTYEIYPTNTLR